MMVDRPVVRSSSTSSRSERSPCPMGARAKVIDDQDVDPGKLREASREAAVAVSDAQFLHEAREARVEHREALAAGLVTECAGNPTLAETRGAGGDHRLAGAHPVAGGKRCHQTLIEAAHRAGVEVLKASAGVFESRLFEQPLEAARVAPGDLPVDEKSEALLEGERVARGLGELFFERACHAVELQAAQPGEGLLGEHRLLSIAGQW